MISNILPETSSRIGAVTAMLVLALSAAVLFGGAKRASASQSESVTTDCRIDAGPCVKTVKGLTITLDISPKPVKAMRELTFSVVVKDRNKPVEDASVTIGLTMPGMYMGTNTVLLTRASAGAYEGKGVIIRCPSGKKIWQAGVSIRLSGRISTANYIFEVQ